MSSIKPIIFFTLTLLTFNPVSYACKDRIYPESFPVSELKDFDHVVVAKVIKMKLQKKVGWYFPPFEFSANIVESLKGILSPKMNYQISTGNGPARASCPIKLEEGQTYLLFLKGMNNNNITLPRYGTLYLSKKSEMFSKYADEIRLAVKSGGPTFCEKKYGSEVGTTLIPREANGMGLVDTVFNGAKPIIPKGIPSPKLFRCVKSSPLAGGEVKCPKGMSEVRGKIKGNSCESEEFQICKLCPVELGIIRPDLKDSFCVKRCKD